MESCDWEPFVKAAVERSPVSLEMAKGMSIDGAYQWLSEMQNESIYDGKRLAQPDEVANYCSGDGLEKALVMANLMRNREPQKAVEIVVAKERVIVKGDKEYIFESRKGLEKKVAIGADGGNTAE